MSVDWRGMLSATRADSGDLVAPFGPSRTAWNLALDAAMMRATETGYRMRVARFLINGRPAYGFTRATPREDAS